MSQKFIDQFLSPSENFNIYVDYFTRIQVPARTVLLQEGEISRKAYLIEKGCLRAWFNNNGDDVTFQFFFENSTVSSIESFKKGIPSLLSIETIEPCTLWWIEKTNWEKMVDEISQTSEGRLQIMDIIFERTFNYMQHFLSFIRDSPQDRYLSLINHKPYVVQRVPQRYIASYLGISSVHLSRIKANILKQKL